MTAKTSSVVLNPPGGTLHYEWQRYNTDGTFDSVIGGDLPAYLVQDEDLNRPIRLVVTARDAEDTEDYYGSLSYIIKGTPALTKPVTAAPTYNTGEQDLVKDGTVSGGTLWYKLGSGGTYTTQVPTATDAGSYTVYYKVIGNTNYNDIAEASVAVTLSKADGAAVEAPTVSGNQPTVITLTAITAPGNGQTVEYAKNTSASVPSTWQDSPVFTGLTPNTSYYFFARTKENTNYKAGTALSVQASTVKAYLTGSAEITGTPTYGNTLTAVTSLGSTPTVTPGLIHYEWKRGGTTVGTDLATYTLTAADVGQTITVTVTTANTQGSLTSEATAAVSKRKITGTWSVSGSKIYDGLTDLTDAVTVSFTPDNIVGEDAVTVTRTVAFADKNAANNKSITVSNLGVTGAASASYDPPNGPALPLTANVTKRDLSINLTMQEKYYDGLTSVGLASASLDGVQNGESIVLTNGTPTLVSAGSAEQDTTVGVNFTTFSISGDTKENYNLLQPESVSVTVKKNAAASAGAQYEATALSSGWTNGQVIITAKSGYKVAPGGLSNSNWQDSYVLDDAAAEKASGTQKSFHVKEVSTGRISPAVTVSYGVDLTAPSAQVTVKSNSFTSFLNNITFGLFFKETQQVTITAGDAGSGTANSGVAKTEYLIIADADWIAGTSPATSDGGGQSLDVDAPTAGELADADWQTYSSGSKPSLPLNFKGVVYARVTDVAGNVTYASSNGLVIYTDSARADAGTVTYTRTTQASKSFTVNLNGNTVSSVTVEDSSLALSQLRAGTDYQVSGSAPATITLTGTYLETLAAGSYTVHVSVNPGGETYVQAEGNEAPAEVTAALSVVKQTPVVTPPTIRTLTYTGSPQQLVNAGSATGGTFKYAVGETQPADDAFSATIPTRTNADTYKVWYKAFGNDDYLDSAAGSVTVTINRAPATVDTNPEPKNLTYNTTEQELVVAGAATGGQLEYKLGTEGVYGTALPKATNAAQYTVYYRVTGDSNHLDVAERSLTVTVAQASQAQLSIEVATADGTLPTAYDAVAAVTLGGGSGTGAYTLASSDDTVAEVSGSGTSWSVHVIKASGEYYLTATRAADTNYKVQTKSTDAVEAGHAAQAAVTLTGTAPLIYGQSATLTVAGGTGTGALSLVSTDPDVASVTKKLTDTDPSDGQDFTVTVLTADDTYELRYGRAGDENYNALTVTTATFNTVKAQQGAVSISGTLPTVYGDSASVQVSGGTGSGAYTLSSDSAGVLVEPDAAHSGAGAGYFTVRVVAASGNYTLTAGRTGNAGYNDAAPVTSSTKTLSKRTLTGTWSVSGSKVYDGTNALTDAVTVSFSGNNIVDGDDVAPEVLAGFVNKNVGGAVNITVSVTGVTGDQAGYYNPPAGPSETLSAQVSQRKLTGGWQVSGEKTYDGTTDVTGKGSLQVSFTPSNKVDSDTVTVSYTAAFTSAEAGSRPVHISGVSLTGADRDNYLAPDAPAFDASATINRKEVTIAATANSKAYDGTDAATLTTAAISGLVTGQTQGTDVVVNYTYSGQSAVFGAGGHLTSGTARAAFAGVGTPASDTTYAVTGGVFSLGGTKASNYEISSASIGTAKILAGFTAAVNTHYTATTLNADGWTNSAGGYVVTAVGGNLLSESAASDGGEGGWEAALTYTEDTASGSAQFYVKNAAGQISKQVVSSYKLDRTAPAMEIQIRSSRFNTFLTNINFGLFFNSNESVTLSADDVGTVQSGKASVGYYMTSSQALSPDTNWDALSWHSYSTAFALSAGFKGYVYARVTDKAGNQTVVRSDGVVVYTTSSTTGTASYTKRSNTDVSFTVDLAGNTVDWVALYDGVHAADIESDGNPNVGKTESELAASNISLQPMSAGTGDGDAYTVSVNAETGIATFTLNAAWLEALSAGDTGASSAKTYGIIISVDPGGETYVPNNNGDAGADTNDEPATVLVPLTVHKAAASVTWPSASEITYGDALSSSTLSGGASSGRTSTRGFAWADGDAVPTVAQGAAGLAVVFTPNTTQKADYDWASLGGANGITYDADSETLIKAVPVTVHKRQLAGTWDVSGKTYDGTVAASVTFTPTNVLEPDAATAFFSASYGSAAAGEDKPVTVSFTNTGVQGSGMENYLPPDAPEGLTATISKATVAGVDLTRLEPKRAGDETEEIRQVANLLPSLTSPRTLGTVSYDVVYEDPLQLLSEEPSVDAGASKLVIPLRDTVYAVEGQQAQVQVTVHSTNYADYTVTVTVIITGDIPRIVENPEAVGGNPPVYTDDGNADTSDDVAVLSATVRSSSDMDFVWMIKNGAAVDLYSDGAESDDVPAQGPALEISGMGLAAGIDHTLTFHPPTTAAGDVTYYLLATNEEGSNATDAVAVSVTARDYSAAITSPSTSWKFDGVTYGYAAQQEQVFTFTPQGNQALAGLTASVDGSGFEIVAAGGEALDAPADSASFDGTALAADGTWTVTVRPKAGLDADAYSSTLTFTWDVINGTGDGAGAGTATATRTLELTVARKANVLTLGLPLDDKDTDAGDETYTYYAGTYQPVVAENESGGSLSWEWRIADLDTPDSWKDGLPVDASITGYHVEVRATSAQTKNYNALTSGSVKFRIEKAPLTVSVAVADKFYDGLYAATVQSASLVGLMGGHTQGTDVVLGYTHTADSAVFGAGGNLTSGAPSATFGVLGTPATDTLSDVSIGTFAISGAQSGNYKLTQPSGATATIKQASFTAADGVQFDVATALNGFGWTNASGGFTVDAKAGYALSLSSAADGGVGGWTASLTADADTGSGVLTLYAKNTANGQISKAGSVSYKLDRTLPEAEISVGGNAFRTFVNTISFGLFFKDTVSIEIDASDALSGVDAVSYYLAEGTAAEATLSEGDLAALGEGLWVSGDSATVNANWRGAVYARVKDKAGNVAYFSSDGLVVFTDSEQETEALTYVRTTQEAQEIQLATHGNRVGEVMLYTGSAASGEGSTLTAGYEYTVTEDGTDGTVTLSGSWLDTLAAGEYVVAVRILPLGEAYTPEADAEGLAEPETLLVPLTVEKAVPAFSAIEANGGAALTYGHALSSWSLSGTATGATGAVSGTFAWADGSAVPGSDAASARDGLAAGGYQYAVTWTPTGADAEYYDSVDGLSALAFVSQAAPYMTQDGARPVGSSVLTGMYLDSASLSGSVSYDFAGEASGKKAAEAGAWKWDTDGDGVPDDEDAVQDGAVAKASDTLCAAAGYVTPRPKATFLIEIAGEGIPDKRFMPLTMEADVVVFSPKTVIVDPAGKTAADYASGGFLVTGGVYGNLLADVFANAPGDTNAEKTDAAFKALGFKAIAVDGVSHGALPENLQAYIDDPACDITGKGTFGWQDYHTVLNAGDTQDAVVVFAPDAGYLLTDEELAEPDFVFDPGAPKYAKDQTTVTVSIGKANAAVLTAPAAVDGLVYDGAAHALLTAGTATGGELVYRVSGSAVWSADVPEATASGTYEVFYMVAGDAHHNDVAETGPLAVLLDKAPAAKELDTELAAAAAVVDGIYASVEAERLHEDDYPAGALAQYEAAYSAAAAAVSGGDLTQAAAAAALAELQVAESVLVQDHPVLQTALDGQPVSGAVTWTAIAEGDLSVEIKGHMPHVARVELAGPGDAGTVRVLWELADAASMNSNEKALFDGLSYAGSLTEGSAVVTLDAAYLASLDNGEYTLTVTFTDPVVAAALGGSAEEEAVRAAAAQTAVFAVERTSDGFEDGDDGDEPDVGGDEGGDAGDAGGSGSSGGDAGNGANNGNNDTGNSGASDDTGSTTGGAAGAGSIGSAIGGGSSGGDAVTTGGATDSGDDEDTGLIATRDDTATGFRFFPWVLIAVLIVPGTLIFIAIRRRRKEEEAAAR
ncbi:MAG: YDG domain-containing protein [Clostridiales Family XIII bacterium]|nr:YDG domain-containing protein [Clostridiales Family XIII bacterium]